jgi:hypothetical protein
MDRIEAVIGESLVRKLDGTRISTESVLSTCQVLGLFSAHMSQELSQSAAEHLVKVMDEINEPGSGADESTDPGVRLAIIVLPQDVAPADSAILEGQHGAYVMDCDKRALVAAEGLFRMELKLSMAIRLPELLLLDTASGKLVSTDAASRVCDGELKPSAFPAGWTTNVFQAASPMSVAGVTARLSEATMLRLGLYPGDPVSVRSLSTGQSVYLQAGGSDDVAEEDLAALHTGTGSPPDLGAPNDSSILLPASVLAVLGARVGSPVTVDRAAEPTAAATVSVQPITGTADADSKPAEQTAAGPPSLPEGAPGFFGLPRGDAAASVSSAIATMLSAATPADAGAASAAASGSDPGEGDDAAAQLSALLGDSGSVPSWLLEHVRSSDCKHRLVGAGQFITVRVAPAAGAAGAAGAKSAASGSFLSDAVSLATSEGTPASRARALAAAVGGAYAVFRVTGVGKGEYVARVAPATSVVRA